MEIKKTGIAAFDNNEMNNGKQGARDVYDARFRMAKRFEERSPEESKSAGGRRRGRKSTKGAKNTEANVT